MDYSIRFCVSIILIMCLIVTKSECYKPVFLIHGLNDNAGTFKFLAPYIEKAHPGTEIVPLNLYCKLKSFLPIWIQAKGFAEAILNHPNYTADGVHLLGLSQGGIIARAVLAILKNHNVHTFISLSSPQMGQYGVDSSGRFIPNVEKKWAYKFFYTAIGQLISVANYWNDPHHQNMYLRKNVFLPVLNNQVSHSKSEQFKESFLILKNVVLIGGPDDGVIIPWQSSQFGFYDSDEKIVPMAEQDVYMEDSFGLQSLDKSGRLKRFTMAEINHYEWPYNATVIDEFILPFLD